MGKHTAKVQADREVRLWQVSYHSPKMIGPYDVGHVSLSIDVPGVFFAPENMTYLRRNLHAELDAIIDSMRYQHG